MGMPWPNQVRFMHLAIFALAMIPIFMCLSYLNANQLHTTESPLKSFEGKPVGNANQSEKNEHHSLPVQGAKTPKAAKTSNQNPETAKAPELNNTQDLTRGVATEIIYEGGHAAITSPICPELGKNLKLFICVTSAPANEASRLAVRETWGHFAIRRDVAIAFILGATANKTLNDNIDAEQEIYGDIIRGNFLDTYDNLTLKTISMLEWANKYCPKVAFVLKTDDDMFINVSKLLAFIKSHSYKSRTIYGRLARKWKPVRNKKSKYYISPQQYKLPVFPDFTTGPAYLFPAHIAKELYTAALNHAYFRLEDVFVTGIVANDLKIKRIHEPAFLNKKVAFTPCNIQREISIHMVKSTEQYDLWKKLHEMVNCTKN